MKVEERETGLFQIADMRDVIFACRKLPRIRSGHRVLVYNNVTQKSDRGGCFGFFKMCFDSSHNGYKGERGHVP
jgi:hypothetical protein